MSSDCREVKERIIDKLILASMYRSAHEDEMILEYSIYKFRVKYNKDMSIRDAIEHFKKLILEVETKDENN